MSYQVVDPEYVLLDWKGRQSFVGVDNWVEQSTRQGREKGEVDALSRCPNEVRHAIAMFGMWRGLIRYESPVVRAYAHAFVAASQSNSVWSLSAMKRPFVGNRWHTEVMHSRGGIKCMIGRTLHYFGKSMNKLSVHGPNANKTAKDRIGVDPWHAGRSYDQDDQPNGVVELHQDTFSLLKQRGLMVRVKAKSYEAFLTAIRPTMQPYFSDTNYRPLFTRIRKPRSESISMLVPISVTIGMDWLTPILPYAIRESYGCNYDWVDAEMKRYKAAREEYAMQTLASGGDLKDRLELFDKTAEAMYLQPAIEPRRKIMHSPDGREQLGVVNIPGLNGQTMADAKVATPALPPVDEE